MPHFALPTIRYLKASPDTAIIGQDMLVDIMFIANVKKIGEHRQPTNCNTDHENESQIDYDNKVVKKYLYGTYPLQSRVQVSERALANNVHSYEWDNQGSMWK
jgi:hypothetical protein